jgi:glycosyltransferase involved in cell wall biosynthesis
MQPLVTVCIPVFNRPVEIKTAIRSVLNQTVPVGELDLLVVDNHSTDDTWKIIQSFADPRLRAVRNPRNLGLFGNFNRCRDLALGKYVRFLCSDDWLTPHCLPREIAAMEANPTAVLLNTPLKRVDASGRTLGTSSYLKPGLYSGSEIIRAAYEIIGGHADNLFNFPSGLLLRKTIVDKVGPFDLSLHGAADFDFWLRMLRHGDLLMRAEPGCEVVIHPNQEGHPLFLKGLLMRANFEIARRSDENSLARAQLMRQMGGRCVWYTIKCLGMKNLRAAKTHWELLSEYGVSYPGAVTEFLHFLSTKIKTRYLHLPVELKSSPKEYVNA